METCNDVYLLDYLIRLIYLLITGGDPWDVLAYLWQLTHTCQAWQYSQQIVPNVPTTVP